MIQLYDRVKLKDGHEACIVEILKAGVSYVADIERPSGAETDIIGQDDIEMTRKEYKQTLKERYDA